MDDSELGKTLLGCLMIDNSIFTEIEDIVEERHFGNFADKQLFNTISSHIKNGDVVDLATIEGHLEGIKTGVNNPLAYLGSIMKNTPSAANAKGYAKALAKLYGEEQLEILYKRAATGDQIARIMLDDRHNNDNSKCKTIENKIKPVPKHIQEIVGVIGEVAMIHNQTSVIPQKDFAITTALAFASACYGRYIETPTKSRSTLLILNCGITGSGKEHSYTILNKIFSRLDVDVNSEDGISSERAIYQALQDNPNTVLLFDEVWKLLAQANAGKGSAGQGALAAIMSLYSKTGAEFVKPPRRANVEDEAINYPALTMLGASTVEKLAVTMESIQSVDGFTNRLLMVDVPYSKDIDAERLLNRPSINKFIDESLSLKELISFFKDKDPSRPVKVDFDHDGREEYYKVVLEYNTSKSVMSTEGQALFQRSLDNSLRVASLLAVSVAADFNKPIVTAKVMRWSWDYVSYWSKHMGKRFEFDVFNNDTEKARESVKELLCKQGNKTGLTGASIRNRCRTFGGLSITIQNQLLIQMCSEGDLMAFDTEKSVKYLSYT